MPLGVTDSLPSDKQKTGRPGNGGTIATAGGLVFVGATDDARFRAFEAKTGKELWTYKLGGAAFATPSTYLGKDGRQYVVIASTGGGLVGARQRSTTASWCLRCRRVSETWLAETASSSRESGEKSSSQRHGETEF